MKDSKFFKMGGKGEDWVRDWLKRQGKWVIPVAKIDNGGAPMLEEWGKQYVLPDLMAGRGGRASMVEVKTKSRITFNVKRQRFEHGIPLRHWNDYKVVCEKIGCNGEIAILDLGGECLYLASIASAAIAAHEAHDSGTIKAFREPMVFFDMRRFTKYDIKEAEGGPSISPAGPAPHCPLPPSIQPNVVQPWESNRTGRQEGHQTGLF